MLSWLKARLQVPVPEGPTEVLRRMEPSTAPITRDGVSLTEDGWCIRSSTAGTVRLFELALSGVDACMLTYRLALRTENATGIFLQMWCRFEGRGEFFSKGINDKVRGTTDWSSHEVPFLLRAGQSPDLLKLDLVFEGPGTAWVRDVEVLRTHFRRTPTASAEPDPR